jgi:hypothetical protein
MIASLHEVVAQVRSHKASPACHQGPRALDARLGPHERSRVRVHDLQTAVPIAIFSSLLPLLGLRPRCKWPCAPRWPLASRAWLQLCATQSSNASQITRRNTTTATVLAIFSQHPGYVRLCASQPTARVPGRRPSHTHCRAAFLQRVWGVRARSDSVCGAWRRFVGACSGVVRTATKTRRCIPPGLLLSKCMAARPRTTAICAYRFRRTRRMMSSARP